jgi:agmatine/peptidylarginine deiminase
MSSRAWRIVAAAGMAAAAAGPGLAQVVRTDGTLYYPPDASISRALTPVERAWLKTHPNGSGHADLVTPPPTGPIHCAAEYEPMEGIIITWVGGQTAIQGQLGRWITTAGNADLWVVLPSAGTQASATTVLTNAGANMSRVRFVQPPAIDSVWQRDYGPRYIYEGDCRAIIDHRYNRPRPNDDAFPVFYSTYRHHAFYALGLGSTQLIHGGGNFHLDALNRSYATRLTVNENPTLTEPQIVGIWGAYQGVEHTFFNPFPISVDSTQHLDMWMQVLADDKVVISTWPNNPGSTQATICDNAAATMAGRGYTVYRTPAFSIGGTHYTYTNMVMCNNVVMVPSYNQATVAPNNAPVLATLQAALPGKTVVQVNCDPIIGLAGAIHCIVMHVPVHRGPPGPNGGLSPTALVHAPNGGEALTPGSPYMIRWISDDDAGVSNVDLLLSTDGGQTFPTVIASQVADTGSFMWAPPPVNTAHARVRVVARDGAGNTGFDASDNDFTIGAPPACYANCDQSTAAPILNVNDFICFQNRFAAGDSLANCDQSTTPPVLNVNDFICFQGQFAAGCP